MTEEILGMCRGAALRLEIDTVLHCTPIVGSASKLRATMHFLSWEPQSVGKHSQPQMHWAPGLLFAGVRGAQNHELRSPCTGNIAWLGSEPRSQQSHLLPWMCSTIVGIVVQILWHLLTDHLPGALNFYMFACSAGMIRLQAAYRTTLKVLNIKCKRYIHFNKLCDKKCF